MKHTSKIKLLSGVFEVKPKSVITLFTKGNVPGAMYGMVKLTPKKSYRAFKAIYTLNGNTGEYIFIIKDGYRWFPVTTEYAKQNFTYTSDLPMFTTNSLINGVFATNEHIRNADEMVIFD